MTDPVAKLLRQVEDLPTGPARVEVLAEAARVADAHNDARTGFAVRQRLMNEALGAGLPDQMTVAFTWCVAQSERDPDSFPPNDILWQYRWVISELPHFPEVPRKQIEDTIAEMTRRYRSAGSTLRPVHLMRVFTYTKMGDLEAAKAARTEFETAGRDWLSDSPRQERNLIVNHLCAAGRYQEAIDLSENVLTGRVDDPGFFGQDSAELLIPLLELGRVADAVRVQRSGYRYLARKNWVLAHIAFHVEFLARVDNFPAAAKVVDDHMPIAVATKQFVYRTHFLRSVLLLVSRLRFAGQDKYKFRLPKEVPVSAGWKGYDLVELTKWLNAEVADYSERFDARNGNTYFADKLAVLRDLASRPAPTA